jgi:hypothetical protein
MIAEEVGLNEFLEANGITPVETDLGEYIIQLRHEPPSQRAGRRDLSSRTSLARRLRMIRADPKGGIIGGHRPHRPAHQP